MKAQQPDLFGAPGTATPEPAGLSEEVVAIIRGRLQALLARARVRGAERMPWDDHLQVIHADNEFRSGWKLLPPDEGAPMWAEFDAEMDRLYAIMNEGLEPDTLELDSAE